MLNNWIKSKEWPELFLESLEEAGVARITFNRPRKRNVLNESIFSAVFEALEKIRADREIKAVITRGARSVYSAGLDLHFLRSVSNSGLLDWDRPTPTI